MRQRQPNGTQLKQSGRSRIKNPAGNIEVGNGVAIKKDGALTIIKDQGANGDDGGNPRELQQITTRRGVHGDSGYAFASPALPRYLSSSSPSFCRVAAGILSLSVWMANCMAEPQAHLRSFGIMAMARFTTFAAFSALAWTTFSTWSTVTSSCPARQQS